MTATPTPPNTESTPQRLTIALAGNPNSGKSTLFNALTRGRAEVANYPGVTVEAKSGTWRGDMVDTHFGGPVEVIDVPGCYALTARSPEESVAIQTLRGVTELAQRPDVVLNVVDATNLERNLYLTLQIQELGLPTVVVLSMMDMLEREGASLDVTALEEILETPVVVATRGDRMASEDIAAAVLRALKEPSPCRRWAWDNAVAEATVKNAADALEESGFAVSRAEADGLAHWCVAQFAELGACGDHWSPQDVGLALEPAPRAAVETALETLEAELAKSSGGRVGDEESPDVDDHVDGPRVVEAMIGARYAWLAANVRPLIHEMRGRTISDRIDRVITNRVVGPLLFLTVMALVFQLMFSWAAPLIGLVESAIGVVNGWIMGFMGAGLLRDLLTEGVVSGVGNVLVFLPQIVILFALLALLKTSGYLARAAYIMDRVMSRVGLHGKAFVPLLTSFACAVPGIAATRTIENRSDRFVTILVAPLMTCSARIPVYALLITTFFEANQPVFGVFTLGGLILLALYVAGMVAALLMAALLKRTIFKSPRPPLILELPPYHVPRLTDVWREVRHGSWIFIRDAGTIILACTVILWAVLSFPKAPEVEAHWDAQIAELEARAPAEDAPEELSVAFAAERMGLQQARNAAVVEASIAGQLGVALRPVFEPLGFDVKVSVGLIAALSAREVMVSALGVSYGVGDGADEESVGLRAALKRDPNFTPAVAISLLVWFAFAFQCIATLAAVKRETQSWRWPIFLVVYQTGLAWVGAFVAYRVAIGLGLG